LDAYLFDTGRTPTTNPLNKDNDVWRITGPAKLKTTLNHLDDWQKLLKSRLSLFSTDLPTFSWPSASDSYATRLASARGELSKSMATGSKAKIQQNILSMVYLTMLLYATQFQSNENARTLAERQKALELESRFLSCETSTPLKILLVGVLWTPVVALLPTDLKTMSVTHRLIITASHIATRFIIIANITLEYPSCGR
jgi:hypothetical protein